LAVAVGRKSSKQEAGSRKNRWQLAVAVGNEMAIAMAIAIRK
jgi:hypothetical protein